MQKYCKFHILVVIVLAVSWLNIARADTNGEYKLKAAYLLNFARFIYWPEEIFSAEEKHFNICVYGENPFEDNLEQLSSKKIKSKNVQLIYTKKFEEIKACQMVYICESEIQNYLAIIKNLTGPRLTVSDISGFSEAGGMIEFIRVKNKIKFEINVKQSEKAGIKYRSQLLEVAERLR